MSRIEFYMTIRGPLHMGTGMSRLGEIDRIVRRQPDGAAAIGGEQIKGAVRASAERLLRWLGAGDDEDDGTSFPRHPVLARLFAATPERFVRFEPLKSIKGATCVVSSTAIDPETGAAKEKHLRTIEMIDHGAEFRGRIALYGDWTSSDARLDALFLCAAVLSLDGIGSRKGTGLGAIEISTLTCDAAGDLSRLGLPATVTELRQHVKEARP